MKYQMVSNESETTVDFSGEITEESTTELQKVAEELKAAKDIVFNLANVTKINSLGVRSWVQFIRAIGPEHKLAFSECAPVTVLQINMIPSFRAHATIDSVICQYSCSSCRALTSTVVECSKYDIDNLPPAPPCSKCGSETELDEDEEEYFGFLKRK